MKDPHRQGVRSRISGSGLHLVTRGGRSIALGEEEASQTRFGKSIFIHCACERRCASEVVPLVLIGFEACRVVSRGTRKGLTRSGPFS